MPLPTLKEKEARKDYIDRCMSDPQAQAEYADPEQRIAVCQRTYRDASARMNAVDEGHEIVAEVFAVGKWNGMSFTADDLSSIVEAFRILGDKHRVPLKLGHNDEQPQLDGKMALGWVDDVWVEDEKLYAKFTAVPEVVYDAIKKRMYRNVSVELDMDVVYKGDEYPFVLSGVALLGADLPAVNTLADLQTYLHHRQVSGSERKFFSVTPRNSEDSTMTPEEKQELIDLKNRLREVEAEKSNFERENADYERKLEEEQEKAEKLEFSNKRAELTGKLSGMVEAKKLTPGLRDKFNKEIETDDSASFEKVGHAIEVLEEFNGQVAVHERDAAASGGDSGSHSSDQSPDEQLAHKALSYSRQHHCSFREAMIDVMRDEPELAEGYKAIGTEHHKG